MEKKHTPNWKLGRISKKGSYQYIDGKNWGSFAKVVIAISDVMGKRKPSDEGIANAKLIVAAPDLLEQLIAARKTLISEGWIDRDARIIDIDKAIKKATE
jgi:hypothetical protein